MIKKTGSRGFTLIELLVVIAIIGILASVVLASLNTARNKGADAAIKSNLANIRAQAEIVYDGNNCYADGIASSSGCSTTAFGPAACAATADTLFAEPTVQTAWTAARTASGGTSGLAACASTASQTAWAIAVPLKTAGKGHCVDSTGVSKEIDNSGTAYNQTALNGEITGALCGS